LNRTFARLRAAWDRQGRFTANASHELRTPLTVILSDSQGALRQERTPAEYRATLEAIQLSALRMKAITTPGNQGSLEFHRALGYRVEMVPNYAGPGRDRYVFARELSSG
jgi:signal transduction histidine kinase